MWKNVNHAKITIINFSTLRRTNHIKNVELNIHITYESQSYRLLTSQLRPGKYSLCFFSCALLFSFVSFIISRMAILLIKGEEPGQSTHLKSLRRSYQKSQGHNYWKFMRIKLPLASSKSNLESKRISLQNVQYIYICIVIGNIEDKGLLLAVS